MATRPRNGVVRGGPYARHAGPRCAPLAWKPNNYINRVADGLGVDLEPEMQR